MNKQKTFYSFIESLKNDKNELLLSEIKYGFKIFLESENNEEFDIEKSLSVINNTDQNFINQLKKLLTDKFQKIEQILKTLLRPASKGIRKGQLIFVPDAARQISKINDEFMHFIIRDIYDHYRDITNNVFWQMHMNWLFSGDYILELMKELNEKIRVMEQKKKEIKEFYAKQWTMIWEQLQRYETGKLYRSQHADNIFNKPEVAQRYNEIIKIFKDKVKKEHPRVPDGTFWKYVNDNYSYREEYQKLKEDFLNTFPEYVELKKKQTEKFDNERNDIKIMDEQIKEELKKLDYDNIKKIINAMVNFFVKKVSTAIANNDIKLTDNQSNLPI